MRALGVGSIDILTVGEILIDMISTEYGDTFADVAHFRKLFGGSPANIAVNTSRLGLQSAIITNVGRDGFGHFLVDQLMEYGVSTDGVRMDPDHKTTLITVLKSRTSPDFIAFRDADRHIRIAEKERALLSQAKIVHFSTFAFTEEPARSALLEAMRFAKAEGKVISLDPNYREEMWKGEGNGAAFVRGLLAYADIVKPSEDDARALFGEATREEWLSRFAEAGPGLVMLTLGADGVMAMAEGQRWSVPSYATDIVDTTGAGDAFWSGFYASYVHGDDVQTALKMGSVMSAAKLKHVGAIAPLPTLEEARLQLKRLSR